MLEQDRLSIPSPENRRTYLGGTDIPAIMGVSPWKSAFEVWQYKTGRIEPIETNEAMSWGLALEDAVLTEYGRRYHVKVTKAPWKQDPKRPYIAGSVDAIGEFASGEFGVLECKVVNANAKRIWEREIPLAYQQQAQLYMHLHGLQFCMFVVLFGGQELGTFKLSADPILQHLMLITAERFWERFVLLDVPPGHEDFARETKPRSAGGKQADAECVAKLQELISIRDARAHLEEQEEHIVEWIKTFAGNESVLIGDAEVATWATKNRKAQVLEAKSWTQFTVKPSSVLSRHVS